MFAFAFLIYMLATGDEIFRLGVNGSLPGMPPTAERIGRRGWVTLGAYFRGVVAVGTLDGVLIGLGLVILGVPLAATLALLIFIFRSSRSRARGSRARSPSS